MQRSPFFIVGVGRSGTTLLRLMLHSHPGIAIPYESHFITKYMDEVSSYGDLTVVSNLNELVNDILNEDLLKQWDHDFDVTRILEKVAEPNLSGVFNAIYQDYCEGKQKQRWGDKSDYLDRIDEINELFPDARFIHIIRDGRDVASSVLKLPWGPKDIIQAAEWWNFHVILGRKMGNMLGPKRYIEVKFEDLVSDTEKELIKLCAFIGEDFDKSMLSYYQGSEQAIPDARRQQHYNTNKPPDPSRNFAWKRAMTKRDIALFNCYASETLDDLGYEVEDNTRSNSRLLIDKLCVFVLRAISRKKRK